MQVGLQGMDGIPTYAYDALRDRDCFPEVTLPLKVRFAREGVIGLCFKGAAFVVFHHALNLEPLPDLTPVFVQFEA
jgi:hypothetical protein